MGHTEHFITALVGSPFGLSGRVKIESLSGEEDHLLGLQTVILRQGEQEKKYTEKKYIIDEIFTSPLSIKFKGVDSPEAAKTLRGAEILIPREKAAPLQEGEFYIEDLRGLEVHYKDSAIGKIHDLIEGGSCFLVEVLLESGEKKLVPFRNEFFGSIDLSSGRAELLETWILE